MYFVFNLNTMEWHWNGLLCADVPLRNCSLTHSRNGNKVSNWLRYSFTTNAFALEIYKYSKHIFKLSAYNLVIVHTWLRPCSCLTVTRPCSTQPAIRWCSDRLSAGPPWTHECSSPLVSVLLPGLWSRFADTTTEHKSTWLKWVSDGHIGNGASWRMTRNRRIYS